MSGTDRDGRPPGTRAFRTIGGYLISALNHDVVALLEDAVNRYRSVHLSVFYWANEPEVFRGMRHFPQNKALMVVADDMRSHPDRRRNQSIWSVFVDRPYRYRVEQFISSDRLYEIASGNEREYWQYFPAARRASLLPHQPDQTKTPLPLFMDGCHRHFASFSTPSSF